MQANRGGTVTPSEDRIRALPCWNGAIEIAVLKGGISNESFLVTDAGGRLIGVVSDGDVRRFVSSDHFALDAAVALAMTPNPKVIGAEDSLKDALALMEKYKIFVLFALDQHGIPQGVIHMHHIIEEKIV